MEANHVQVMNEHFHHDNVINIMEVKHMTIFDGSNVQGEMQPNKFANWHDNVNDTMRVDDILKMDATKDNEQDMMASMGKGHDHERGNPWHNEFEEAS